MATLRDIEDAPFVKVVMEDAWNAHETLGIEWNDLEGTSGRKPNELQFYQMTVGFSLAHLIGWARQLEQIVAFMSEFSYSSKALKGKVSRFDHLMYHIENYYVRVNSIYDRSLQLTNSVFHLCISEENVSHVQIVSNLKVKRTQVPALLKKVRKVNEKNDQIRHTIVHKHSYQDPSLQKLELFYMYSKDTWPKDGDVPFERIAYVRSQRMRTSVSRYKSEFKKINSELHEALIAFLSGMEKEYKAQSANLAKIIA